MADLAVAASVTRAELALAALDLSQPGVYKVVSWGPGLVAWDRQTVRSRFVHGETLVGAVKQQASDALVVRAYGATHAQLRQRIKAVTDAFSQFSYDLTVTIEGEVSTHRCDPADYTVGEADAVQKFHLMALQQEVSLTVPRQPVPTVGAF